MGKGQWDGLEEWAGAESFRDLVGHCEVSYTAPCSPCGWIDIITSHMLTCLFPPDREFMVAEGSVQDKADIRPIEQNNEQTASDNTAIL